MDRGTRDLELLNQVWFAEPCTAGALLAMGIPLLPHLDVLAVALCRFLAAGRVGCTLVGCCHGRVPSIDFVYGEEHMRDGSPRTWPTCGTFPCRPLRRQESIAVSRAAPAQDSTFHVSISHGIDDTDLSLLCEIAARTLPSVTLEGALLSRTRTFHLLVHPAERMAPLSTTALYGDVVRRLPAAPDGMETAPTAASTVPERHANFAGVTLNRPGIVGGSSA
jgi:hypothetical protein